MWRIKCNLLCITETTINKLNKMLCANWDLLAFLAFCQYDIVSLAGNKFAYKIPLINRVFSQSLFKWFINEK